MIITLLPLILDCCALGTLGCPVRRWKKFSTRADPDSNKLLIIGFIGQSDASNFILDYNAWGDKTNERN